MTLLYRECAAQSTELAFPLPAEGFSRGFHLVSLLPASENAPLFLPPAAQSPQGRLLRESQAVAPDRYPQNGAEKTPIFCGFKHWALGQRRHLPGEADQRQQRAQGSAWALGKLSAPGVMA